MVSAVLAFLGFMHGSAVGWAVSPTIASAYLLVGILFYGLAKMDVTEKDDGPIEEEPVTEAAQ